ncbi:MAG: hypothetical protein ACI9YB_002993 [Halioglobus sp.]|jgi:hypothetical protein
MYFSVSHLMEGIYGMGELQGGTSKVSIDKCLYSGRW